MVPPQAYDQPQKAQKAQNRRRQSGKDEMRKVRRVVRQLKLEV
jgi:hypothetical protein